MGLMDLIRKAEEQSRSAARRGRELARATLNESGRMLRRKMRVNPPASANSKTEPASNATPAQTAGSLGAGTAASRQPRAQAQEARKKIISINGQDVRTEEVAVPGRRRSA
jgi:hypothetical protein